MGQAPWIAVRLRCSHPCWNALSPTCKDITTIVGREASCKTRERSPHSVCSHICSLMCEARVQKLRHREQKGGCLLSVALLWLQLVLLEGSPGP